MSILYIEDARLSHYNLKLINISQQLNEVNGINNGFTLTLEMTSDIASPVKVDKLIQDLTLLNNVRESTDITIQDAFEQLLTIMALKS